MLMTRRLYELQSCLKTSCQADSANYLQSLFDSILGLASGTTAEVKALLSQMSSAHQCACSYRALEMTSGAARQAQHNIGCD